MTTAASTDSAPPYRWLRVLLVLIGALEFLDALPGVQNIFTDYHHDTALLRFAQGLTSVRLALSPLLAGAALVFAALGNIRSATLALAALILTTWLMDSLPAIAIHGLRLKADFGALEEFVLYFFAPSTAVAAAILALRDRLALAAALVSLPFLFKWVTGVIFIVALMIYGF